MKSGVQEAGVPCRFKRGVVGVLKRMAGHLHLALGLTLKELCFLVEDGKGCGRRERPRIRFAEHLIKSLDILLPSVSEFLSLYFIPRQSEF